MPFQHLEGERAGRDLGLFCRLGDGLAADHLFELVDEVAVFAGSFLLVGFEFVEQLLDAVSRMNEYFSNRFLNLLLLPHK